MIVPPRTFSSGNEIFTNYIIVITHKSSFTLYGQFGCVTFHAGAEHH